MAKNYKPRFTALTAFVMLAGIFVAASPASAASNSVCLVGNESGVQCDYSSLEQCRATAAGGLGYCVPAFPGRPDEAYNRVGEHHR